VTIDGTINGDVYIGAASVNVSGRVSGDLTYAAEQLDQDKLAVIRGEVSRHQLPESKRWDKSSIRQQMASVWHAAKFGLTALSFAGALVVGLVMLWLMGKPMQVIGDKIQNKFGPVLGWGLVL
jgi:tetrahydromethanopterin S-methyltransferase subunit E